MTFTTATLRAPTGRTTPSRCWCWAASSFCLANAVPVAALTVDRPASSRDHLLAHGSPRRSLTARRARAPSSSGIVVIVALRWQLNILLSEDEARTAGGNVSLMRAVLIVASTVITASVISMCGRVGWVGPLVLHCAHAVRTEQRAVIPVSALLACSR